MNGNALHTREYVAVILIGLLPAWMILLPLDMTSDPEGWQVFVRSNSFAVPLAQLMFVLLAMSIRFSPFKSIRQLPHITKAAVLIWLIVAGFVSFQEGKDHLSALIGLVKIIIASLFLLALVNLRVTYGSRLLSILWIAVGTGAVLYTALWTIHIFMVSPQGDEWIYRIPGVNNVRHTGHFAIAGVIGGLSTLLAFRNNPNIWLGWILPSFFAIAGLGLALWTGSRGPLLASLMTMFVTICVAVQQRKVVAGFCVVVVLATTATVALLPVPHPIYGIAGATGFADLSQSAGYDASSGRTELWKGTMAKIAERPMLGWGLNQFGTVEFSKKDSYLHPHNYPLQLMFSGGLFSVLVLLLIALPVVKQSDWRLIKGPGAAGVGGVVGIVIYSLYDGSLYFSYPVMIFLVAIATSIQPASKPPVDDRSGSPSRTGSNAASRSPR